MYRIAFKSIWNSILIMNLRIEVLKLYIIFLIIVLEDSYVTLVIEKTYAEWPFS